MIKNYKNKSMWRQLAAALHETIEFIEPLSKSSFNKTYRVKTAKNQYFLKTSSVAERLEAEFNGLQALVNSNAIRVPKPIFIGCIDGTGVLVTGFLDLNQAAPIDHQFAAKLVSLHRNFGSAFGWHQNNFIGGSAQINSFCDSWLEFFCKYRLKYQLDLAKNQGFPLKVQSLGEQVVLELPKILGSADVVPSLVHGDLWCGNVGMLGEVPVIYDPAVYYGDRETDLAMMRLFGGFSEAIYRHYLDLWPLADGWELRQKLYQLYHVLNHLNLFGQSYCQSALSLMRSILAEV